ncbi:hypothetical protein HYT02_04205 [Candidatus Gottesmanbacteria bacterium]|nr:hypothetical protein [Candidatus Gottesmanbacteria bacterium]
MSPNEAGLDQATLNSMASMKRAGGVVIGEPKTPDPKAASPDASVQTPEPQPLSEKLPLPNWFDKLSETEKRLQVLIWDRANIVKSKMDTLYPDQSSPQWKELNEFYVMNDYILKNPGQAQYDSANGAFINPNGRKDNIGVYSDRVGQAAKQLEENDPLLREIDNKLVTRESKEFVTVEDENGVMVKKEITIIDRTEVKGDVEILNSQAKALVKKACESLGEEGLKFNNIELTTQMVTEFFSLSKLDSGLPLNVRYQMINDLINRINKLNPDVARELSGLTISYPVKDANGQDQLVSTSISQLASESQIRSKELLQLKPEDKNPIVARIKKGLLDKGFTEEDIEVFEAEAESNGLDSWDYIGDILRLGHEYSTDSKNPLVNFTRRHGLSQIKPKDESLAALAKKDPEKFMSMVKGLNKELVGSEEGITDDMLRWAEENLKLKNLVKKLKRDGFKLNLQDVGMWGLIFSSILLPMMGEGDEEGGPSQ